MGTFLLLGHLVIILFDSGASHDLMSSTCAKRAKLSVTVAKPSYMISTLGGLVVANQIAREVPLELDGQVFHTQLIVLDGQGIGNNYWGVQDNVVSELELWGSTFVKLKTNFLPFFSKGKHRLHNLCLAFHFIIFTLCSWLCIYI
jgi:hypothetical protein